MRKFALFLIAFSLFLIPSYSFLGLFDENPQWLIFERVEAGARLYTGISPISVDNDSNQVGLNVLSTSDWNGTLDGFEGLDLNLTVLGRCVGDDNHVWTSANNCQSIVGFDTGGGGGGITEADGTDLYVRLNPTIGKVINFDLYLNHVDGHTFLGHTFFIGNSVITGSSALSHGIPVTSPL